MNEALALVDSLAVRLKAPAEAIWEAYVRQAYVSGITHLIQLILFGLFLWLWVSKFAPALAQKARDTNSSEDELMCQMALFVVSAVALVATLIVFFDLNNLVAKLVNPQYWAIQQILGR